MTILTQSPSVVQLNAAPTSSTPKPTKESSLAELRAARKAWLRDAIDLGYIDDAMQIARWLGTWSAVPRRPMASCWTWQDPEGALKITLYEWTGNWSPADQAYTVKRVLLVTAGEHDVVNYKPGDSDSWFVPGNWVMKLWAAKPDAEQVSVRAAMAIQEQERARLLAQLLIGVSI